MIFIIYFIFHFVFFGCPYIGNEYDSLLKHFSTQHNELPSQIQKDIDHHTRFKRKFGLYAMDLPFLSEFQCTTMEQTIEKKMLILRTKRRLKHIEKEADKTKNDLIIAKSYVQFH